MGQGRDSRNRLIHFTPSTGDDGRAHARTNDDPIATANTAFLNQAERHFNDTGYSSTEYPVGSFQSKTAVHKLHYRTKFKDLNISVENRAGSYRYWYDSAADKEGKTLQKYPYGYIRLTEGMDGDHIDCYLGPNEDAKYVYVITTNSPPDFKKEDEQKCMLGFDSASEAKNVFLQHYDNPRFFRGLTALPYNEFRDKVLLTRKSRVKKVANIAIHSVGSIDKGPGSFDGQMPGDRLGIPHNLRERMRHIVGDTLAPEDIVDRSFRYMDDDMNTRVLEGTGGLPESPGV